MPITIALWLGIAATACGAQGGPRDPVPAAVVAATVDGQPILVTDVARSIRSVINGRSIGPGATLAAQVLEQLIQRELVHAHLEEMGLGASTTEIDQAIADLSTKRTARKRFVDALFTNESVGEAALRRQVAWELSWKKYLNTYLTDAELKAYFDAHQRDFDGTEVRISHILLRPQGSGDEPSQASLVQKASVLRQQILAGKLTFDEAARKHSAGPSRTRGGDLGFIPRYGLMEEPFSQTAFALKMAAISAPVVTRFGVHLIRVTDVRPGTRTWTDVRRQLAVPVGLELFRKLASAQREKASIEFTGAAPYFRPGTGQLVLPKNQQLPPSKRIPPDATRPLDSPAG